MKKKLTERDFLELEILIVAYRHIGVPYTVLVHEVQCSGIKRLFSTPFIMNICNKNQATMSKLKLECQSAQNSLFYFPRFSRRLPLS